MQLTVKYTVLNFVGGYKIVWEIRAHLTSFQCIEEGKHEYY